MAGDVDRMLGGLEAGQKAHEKSIDALWDKLALIDAKLNDILKFQAQQRGGFYALSCVAAAIGASASYIFKFLTGGRY